MRATLLLCSLALLTCRAEPADFTKSTIRVDSASWNHALFGSYDPDQIDSAPLQHVLLETDDLGFISDPFAPGVDTEKAFHAMSLNYGEEDIVYQLDIAENGFLNNETYAILQNGISKCKIVRKRQLAPAQQSGGSNPITSTTTAKPTATTAAATATDSQGSTSGAADPTIPALLPRLRDSVLDDLRLPTSRQLQEATTDDVNMTTEDVDFLGGAVDIMFVSSSQIKLQNKDFIANQTTDAGHALQDHQFSIKGRIVLGCECSHSHLEDTYIGLGKTRFAIRKLHAKCPAPVLFKETSTTDGVEQTEALVTDATILLTSMPSSVGEL